MPGECFGAEPRWLGASGPRPGCAPSQPGSTHQAETGQGLRAWRAGDTGGERQEDSSPTSAQVRILDSTEAPVPPSTPPAPAQPWESCQLQGVSSETFSASSPLPLPLRVHGYPMNHLRARPRNVASCKSPTNLTGGFPAKGARLPRFLPPSWALALPPLRS